MGPDLKKIVLIVEDEAGVRKLNRLIVERAGYGALLAASGEEALVISRGYREQIHLLLSDMEMPGMNGITLARRIVAERPGIAVLLNSANPVYAAESSFPFLAKPFTPEGLQSAIAQTLESRTLAVAHREAAPIPAADALIGNHQKPSSISSATIWSVARSLAASVRERWRQSPRIPVWIPTAAALVLAMAPLAVHQFHERQSADPYSVSLQSERGLAGEAEAPSGKSLLLNLDVTRLPLSESYEIRVVDGEGESLWQKVVQARGPQVRMRAAALRPGTYFVRVYGRARELLKEYELRVTETH